MKHIIAGLLLAGAVACQGGYHCPGMEIDPNATQAFREEALAAAKILGVCAKVELKSDIFHCVGYPDGTFCVGEAFEDGDRLTAWVLYNPQYGYGPGIGTTALEHELCHLTGIHSETGANDCAARVIAQLEADPDLLATTIKVAK